MEHINVQNALPSYLHFLFSIQYPSGVMYGAVVLICLLIFGIYVYLWYLRLTKKLREHYTFLEVKPSNKTLKTPLSTNQLFTVLHSLEKPQALWEKMIQIKKSISYELVSTKEEGIRFIMRIPVQDVSAAKKTLLAYLPEVEIKEVDDFLKSYSDIKYQQHVIVKNFTLAKSYLYPLQEQAALNQHDPIAYLTAHMTKLEADEMVALQFVCSPLHESTHGGEYNRMSTIKKVLLNNEDISSQLAGSSSLLHLLFYQVANVILFLALSPITILGWVVSNQKDMLPLWVFETGKRKRLNDIGHPKQELYQEVYKKISQPLFEVAISVFITSNSSENGKERLKGIISSFDTFTSSNQSLRLERSFQNSLIQKFQYFQLKKRLSLFQSSIILSVSELSSLYHLPYTSTTKTEDLLHIKSPKLPSPLSLKQSNIDFDTVFANNIYGETTTPIGLTLEERRRHTYIIGATGTGKTTLLLQMIHQDIKNGKGLAILDPHGDLAERLLGIIPKDRLDDVVYVNPYDIEYPIGLNVLELPKGLSPAELQREKDFITSTLISIFHKLYDARYSGPRMEHVLRNTILTALELENPTLFTVYKLLTDKKFRKQAVSKLNDEILKTFWKNEFEQLGSYQKAEQISPITNKLGRFLTTSMTRNILNQTESKLDFETIMNNKKILICNLSKGKIGEDTAYFLGSLLIAKIQLTALRRVHIPEHKRADFFLYIDEFQNFATLSFAQLLSEARKYRLSAILAHQNTVQLESDLLETIIGNSGTLISFRTTSPKDEDKLLPVFSPEVEKGQIANLPSYNFYVKINALQPQSAFTGEVENFTIKADDAMKEEVINLSREKYGHLQKMIVDVSKKVVKNKATVVNKFEALKPSPAMAT